MIGQRSAQLFAIRLLGCKARRCLARAIAPAGEEGGPAVLSLFEMAGLDMTIAADVLGDGSDLGSERQNLSSAAFFNSPAQCVEGALTPTPIGQLTPVPPRPQ